MSEPQQQHAPAAPRSDGSRPAFAAPRLELPRFQLRPTTLGSSTPAPPLREAPVDAPPAPPVATAPAPAAPAPAPAAPTHHAPQPTTMPTYQATATALAQPLVVATSHAPAPATPPPLRAAPAPTSNSTSAAPTSWSLPAPEPKQSLLQRISPIHMGVLMVLVMVMLVVTSGPSAMHATPTKLPAAVDGGGTAAGVPLPPRAGTTALAAASNAAPASAKPAPKAGAGAARAATPAAGSKPRAAKVRTVKVGTAKVRARVRAGGIPSPAASANLAVAGGGRVSAGQTGAVRMSGIPSAAAAEQLGPQKLAYRPTDGVTLPRAVGERDSHAVDSHYGSTTLAMEEPAAPVMTPGQAAARAERQVTINQLNGGSGPSAARPAAPAAGYAVAF